MMQKDLISIVVPIYNVEKYLERCVKSIIQQTHKEIEIILVDDGSTDSSGYIAENLKQVDDRIHVYHKENGGLSDARNYGIKRSTGKYICFVDSDDCVNEKYIECLYRTLVENGAEIACVGLQEFSDDDALVDEIYDSSITEIYEKEEAIEHLYGIEKYQNYAWNKIYLKSLFDNVEYPLGRKMEDLGTTYLLFDECNKVAYNPIKLYYYYQRENSILHRIDVKFLEDKYFLIKQRYLYLSEKYPKIEVVISAFFWDCLWLLPYQSKQEQKWAAKELKDLWPKVKHGSPLKHRIIYCLYRYANCFYMRKYKKCLNGLKNG